VTDYKDFRTCAGWRAAGLITHEVYVKLAKNISPWSLYVRGARLETFLRDIMHVVYIGFGRDFVASILAAELAYVPANMRQSYLNQVSWEMNQWLKAHKMTAIRRSFTMANIGRDKWTAYPELASSYKAIHVKHMLHYFTHRLSSWHTDDRIWNIISICSWALTDFLFRLDVAGLYLTDSERPP
jgi:hypothetical protein